MQFLTPPLPPGIPRLTITSIRSTYVLLASLVLMFVISPFIDQLPGSDLIEAGLVTVVMVLAVLTVSSERIAFLFALALVIPTLTAKWANHFHPTAVPPEPHLLAGMIFFLYVIANLLKYMIRAPRVDESVLCAAVSGFMLLGMIWVPAYLLVDRLSEPGTAFLITTHDGTSRSFDPFHAMYFSFITLTTVGYGDILPLSRVARMLAVLEAIAGMFYMAILISRLVSAYSSHRVHAPLVHRKPHEKEPLEENS